MMKKQSYILHRRLNYDYPVISRGKGIYLYDKNGRKYLDACGGPAVVNIGYGVKEIAQKVEKLLSNLSYLYGSQFTTEAMEKYGKELCALAPKGLNRVFFVSGGSEGVESAIKLARQYHFDSGNKAKFKIISRRPAYHGDTMLTLSLSSKQNMRKPQMPLLYNFPSIPAPYCYRCPFKETYPGCGLPCALALDRAIKKAGPKTVSSFIAEPIIGSTAAAVIPPPEYFPLVAKICRKHNVLLILDEVKVGFGRTGKWFACQHWNLAPDIVVVGKGIGGGIVPLTAVFCQEKIVKVIRAGSGSFMHSFTFMNNALQAGMGREVLNYVKKNNLVKQSEVRGKYLLEKLSGLRGLDIVGDIRGLGLMVGVELVANKKTKKPFARKLQIAEKVVQAALRRGLVLLFGVAYTEEDAGDAILVTPPFIIAKKEIDKLAEILKASILEVQNNLK